MSEPGHRLRPQRRGRRIAMTDVERDEFLAAERTCRVATVGVGGPHVTPLWFLWRDDALWLYSIMRSRRWTDLQADPRIAVAVDAGVDYLQLRGVEMTGTAAVVGESPRTGSTPSKQLDDIESAFGLKYFGATEMGHDGRHSWLRVTPSTMSSWDFRKLR